MFMQTSLFKVIGKRKIKAVADVNGEGFLKQADFEDWEDNGVIRIDVPLELLEGDYAFWDCGRVRIRYQGGKSPIMVVPVEDVNSVQELVTALVDGLSGVIFNNCSYLFFVGSTLGRKGKDCVFCPHEALYQDDEGILRLIDGVKNVSVCHIFKNDIMEDVEGVLFWKYTRKEPTEEGVYSVPLPFSTTRMHTGVDDNSLMQSISETIEIFNRDLKMVKLQVANHDEMQKKFFELENSFWKFKSEIGTRFSNIERKLEEIYSSISSNRYYSPGKVPSELQCSVAESYNDVITCISDNLNVAKCPACQMTKLLAIVLFAASKLRQPLLLIGSHAKEIADALSLALYGRTAASLQCSLDSTWSTVISSKADHVIVCEGFSRDKAEPISKMLREEAGNDRLPCFIFPRQPARSDLDAFSRFCMPIFMDYFTEDGFTIGKAMRHVDYRGRPLKAIETDNTQFTEKFRSFYPTRLHDAIFSVVPYAYVLTSALVKGFEDDMLSVFGYAQYAIGQRDVEKVLRIIELPNKICTIDWLRKVKEHLQWAKKRS